MVDWVLRLLRGSCLPPPCQALRESRSRIILVQSFPCITPINLNYYSQYFSCHPKQQNFEGWRKDFRMMREGREGGLQSSQQFSQFERMDLTDKQLIVWRELGSELAAPPALCQQALSFYTSYRLQQSWNLDKAALVWRVAYFLSEKAQVLFDGEGKRVRGVALSANAILRDHPRHEEFLYHLRQMTRTVTLPPDCQHLEEEVAHFAKQMAFSLAFLGKLRSTLKRIRVSQKTNPTGDYEDQLQRCLWLLFVDCRAQRALSNDIVENTCLLSCVFVHFLQEKYREEGVYSIYFQLDGDGATLGNEPQELLTFMQAYFLIKDTPAHRRTYATYQQYLEGLARTVELRRFFTPQIIPKSIHSIQRLYSKRLNDQQLDESTFLRAPSSTLHPRMTPFARRGLMAPRNIPALSHRILNYDVQQENQSKLANQQEMQGSFGLLQRLKIHPTPKTTLIRATPMSEAMQMYNWLYDMKNRHPLLPENAASIRQVLSLCTTEDPTPTIIELVAGLWGEAQERCELQTVPPVALLLLSVHLTLHVLNATQLDISGQMGALQLAEVEVWQGLDWLLNFDRSMPVGLRLHLLSVETSFISNRLWRSLELVEVVGEEYQEGKHRLFKRVTHQAALQIHFLCHRLGQSEALEDLSYRIFQEALKSSENLLFERSLEQLVLCCIYAATKVLEVGTKFNEILAVCREVLGLSTSSFQQLVDRVPMGDRRDSIILFYNMVFVPALKGFLRLLRIKQGESSREEGPHVREMISAEAVAAKASQLSSPQMATYLAYSESPILRPRLKELSSNTARQQQYSLQDIEAKFGKLSNAGTLKDTRRTKH